MEIAWIWNSFSYNNFNANKSWSFYLKSLFKSPYILHLNKKSLKQNHFTLTLNFFLFLGLSKLSCTYLKKILQRSFAEMVTLKYATVNCLSSIYNYVPLAVGTCTYKLLPERPKNLLFWPKILISLWLRIYFPGQGLLLASRILNLLLCLK